MSGGTTGTPIAGGSGTGPSIAEPLPANWLTLARYAQIMGIPAPHFFGAQASTAFPISGGCEEAWARHSWQNFGRASREEIALAVEQVEDELSEFIGFSLAPLFITNEVHQYPHHYSVSGVSLMGGIDSRGKRKGVHLRDGAKLIQAGTRGTTKIATATVAGGSLSYTDEDGDGFAETATITLQTSEINACEMKVFITDTLAAEEWEIRPNKSSVIVGGALTMTFNSWLFIDPDTDSAYPDGDAYKAVDISSTSNYVTSVDIYRVYVDNTAVSARFFWERDGSCNSCGGAGCDACSLLYQDGCATVGNVELGVIVPVPAEYDSDEAVWTALNFTYGREPDQVRLSYLAGEMSQKYISGASCDPLKSVYAKAIAYMATARISKPACSCPDLADNFEAMRLDLSLLEDGGSHLVTPELLNNPFGPRRGEVMAWNLLGKISREERVEVAIV